MRAYKTYSKDKRQFCQHLYYDSNTYFPGERSTLEFLSNYHECLLAAGVPKGMQFCDDIFGNDEALDDTGLYSCYDYYKINKIIFVENECVAESSLIIPQKVCIDDLTYADKDGDNCELYRENTGWCGNYDTEFFKSLEMCCGCNGGSQVI